MSADLLATARTLAIDGWTGEAVRALRADGIDSLLLKGPAITSWLYRRGEERTYSDADLLVAPETIPRAEATLQRIGYALMDPEGERERLVSGPHAQTWWRPGTVPSYIDLHHTLPGQVLAKDVAWELLSTRAQTLPVGGENVRVLDEPSRALLVALHAAHHGADMQAPLEDLRRAVDLLDDSTWRAAAMIADELTVLPQFAAGLALVAGGEALARRIAVPDAELLGRLAAEGMPAGLARLAVAAPGDRLELLREAAFPTAAFMHSWAPWSRRSRAALIAAYAYRALWFALHAARTVRVWRRAREAAR